jgi:hypothetical protein
MAERRTFRESFKNATKKSVQLLEKLSPERAVSKIRLNRELVRILNSIYSSEPKPGDWERIKELVSAGANVNIKTFNGTTPLMVAAFYGNINLCAFLLANGADMDAKDKDGETALDSAQSLIGEKYIKDRLKTAKFLISVKPLLQMVGRETLFKAFLPSFVECAGL